MNARGADFSKWDGGGLPYHTLNWSQYSWDFAFIKISEGLYEDPLFRQQWQASMGHAVRGAYHFFRPSVDPKSSALATARILRNSGNTGELPIALDLETLDGMTPAQAADRAFTWLSWFEDETNIRPMVYSGTYFLRDVLQAYRHPRFQYYRLWLAQYPYDKMSDPNIRQTTIIKTMDGLMVPTWPKPPSPFTEVLFWQWSAIGDPARVPGYYTGPGSKKEVDFNFYNGTPAQLAAEFGFEQPIPEPEQPTGENMQGKVITGALNIRPRPDTTMPALKQLLLGDIVEASGSVLGWWRLTKITRAGVNVPLPAVECYAYEGLNNGYIQAMTPVPVSSAPKKITIELADGSVWVADSFTRQA